MSEHIEMVNGFPRYVDENGKTRSITAADMSEFVEVETVLSNNSQPVEISYVPVDCTELNATLELVRYYSQRKIDATEESERVKYSKILEVLEVRIDDMEKRLLYEYRGGK